jgi:hypothetical protein
MQLRDHACLAFSGAVSAGDWTFAARDGVGHIEIGPLRVHANNLDGSRPPPWPGWASFLGTSFVLGEALATGTLLQVLAQ